MVLLPSSYVHGTRIESSIRGQLEHFCGATPCVLIQGRRSQGNSRGGSESVYALAALSAAAIVASRRLSRYSSGNRSCSRVVAHAKRSQPPNVDAEYEEDAEEEDYAYDLDMEGLEDTEGSNDAYEEPPERDINSAQQSVRGNKANDRKAWGPDDFDADTNKFIEAELTGKKPRGGRRESGMQQDFDFDEEYWANEPGFRYEDMESNPDEPVAEVLQGMSEFDGGSDLDAELSLLYDDFEVNEDSLALPPTNGMEVTGETKQSVVRKRRTARKLDSVQERLYEVTAEGIAVRALADHRSPRTGEILREGEKFTAVEALDGEGTDERLYLKLEGGRGWVFDDSKIFPGFPSVKLLSVNGVDLEEEKPEPVKRPLIAVIGRPNVGKSSLVNRICELQQTSGNITYDMFGVTRDRAYNPGMHTDDHGDSYLFEVVDTGGLVFFDDLHLISFAKEIRHQMTIALREAVAAIFVVDSRSGITKDDYEIAKMLRKEYIPRGLKVQVAVAKCDLLATMDYHCAEFWSLGLGEPIATCALHQRGIWEVVDAIVNRGCNGLFPRKLRGVVPDFEPRDVAISVAICGKPNVGKSSLLNALCGEERSIVSNKRGTTTDVVDAYVETDNGKTYRFIDTAGIRKHSRVRENGLEFMSVNRALKAVNRADVTLLVLDASRVMSGAAQMVHGFWAPSEQDRYLARRIEERGSACIIVLSKWDAVVEKDEMTQKRFVQAIRCNLAGVGQWAEIVTCSAKTGQRLNKIFEVIDKTMESHRKRIPTPILNEVVRDACLWKTPHAKGHHGAGRIYYAAQVSSEPPVLVLFCNDPRLFTQNYITYLENKLRQDLNWFGTPMQLEWRKRRERKAVQQAEVWLGPRMAKEETNAWR